MLVDHNRYRRFLALVNGYRNVGAALPVSCLGGHIAGTTETGGYNHLVNTEMVACGDMAYRSSSRISTGN